MNVQPKPSPDLPTDPYAPMQAQQGERRRRALPAGPRLFVTWPVELEVDPWRP
jgi:hypothetical protein